MESLRDEGAGLTPAAVLERWLDVGLMESLRLSEELNEEERAFRLQAARLVVAELAPEGSGIEEKMQAVSYVCAHAASLDYQAQANSRFLAPDTRLTAQRQARQLMALTSRQVAVIAKLRAERRKAVETAERKAKVAALERRTAAEERARAKRYGFPLPEDEEAPTLRDEASPAELKAAGLTRDDLDAFREAAAGVIPKEPLTPEERRAALERLRKLVRDGPEP